MAITYLLHKASYVFPIIGGRKIEHSQANLEALVISLNAEHMKQLEAAVSFELGFSGAIIIC